MVRVCGPVEIAHVAVITESWESLVLVVDVTARATYRNVRAGKRERGIAMAER